MPNRLIHEDSPYLQQHAHNPVDWWPWCKEAFKKAQQENRPIFLSIGYSSCHWCHVMEREVFEDQAIATYLNNHFVSIKVDREERPDIDKHYQSVHQLLNQRPGGWPLSIFMTPDRKPFFAGTYIPPKRKYNMMGFLELIEIIHKKWTQAPHEMIKNADEIERFLTPKEGPIKATKLEFSLAKKFFSQAQESYDLRWGGFGKAPKFPHASTLNLLLDLFAILDDEEALKMATYTMRMMARGGIYDLVDGGFCRYSTDDVWLVPHFEKMTYDNGLLCESYLRAYRATKDRFFLDVAKDIIDFMKKMMMQEHLFYAASDADTEGVEGKYFVYDYAEVIEALLENGWSEKEARSICEDLSITPDGNFEGKNIVRFKHDKQPTWWPNVRHILRTIRTGRTYPFIDQKVITAWNAMMIKALFMAADIDEKELDTAQQSLQALCQLMWPGESQLYHSALAGKQPTIEAFLEDYAYLCDAMLQAYQATLDEAWLIKAQKLANTAIERFYGQGRWYFSRGEFTTEADITDTSYPASSAILTNALLSLGALLDDKRYFGIAFKTIEYHSSKIARYPLYHPTFTTAALRWLKEDWIIKGRASLLRVAKPTIASLSYPWILLKEEPIADLIACNRSSCFAAAPSPEALKASIASFFSNPIKGP